MIIGLKWRDLDVTNGDRSDLVREFMGAGFERVSFDDNHTDPNEQNTTHHVGDDMLIVDVENKIMWTGDWGSYIDLEVDVDFVRTLDKRFGSLVNA